MEKEEVIVKMKKILVLLTLVVGLFGFSTGASAQLIDICNSCKGGTDLGNIACQGAQANCDNVVFNYQTRLGYDDGVPLYDYSSTRYRAIFNICNCETAGTSFVEGHRIGIRLTLLVNGVAGDGKGAYWADPNSANIQFGMYAKPEDTCAVGAYLSLGAINDAGQPRAFGPGAFYKADGITPKTPIADTFCTAVASANQAVTLVTNVDAGYKITSGDVLNKLSRWWIIIPNIRIDPTVLKNGETISVKIETLDQATGGICATCVATCECVIDVAKICPQGGSSTCFFPYFTSTTDATSDNPYWNGIAIVNNGKTAGTATLSVYQQDGKTGTFTTGTIAAGSMFVAALENIGFTGTGLGGKPVYIKVTSTFGNIDGFAMIANSGSGESMGYLCRKPVVVGQ